MYDHNMIGMYVYILHQIHVTLGPCYDLSDYSMNVNMSEVLCNIKAIRNNLWIFM